MYVKQFDPNITKYSDKLLYFMLLSSLSCHDLKPREIDTKRNQILTLFSIFLRPLTSPSEVFFKWTVLETRHLVSGNLGTAQHIIFQ